MYVLDSKEAPPWWRGYFGIQKPLMQALKGAIVFLKVAGRTFAITFGHVLHNLKPESYEYDFGLRATLNSVDPRELRSLDSLTPEYARRQRTQLSVGSDLTLFDFDRDSTILKSLTGKVREDLKPIFKNATGASNIRISSDVTPDGLPALCEKLMELYQDANYKDMFPGIQNVTPVRDPVIIGDLNAKLIIAIKNKEDSVVLTVPEIVDYANATYVKFSGQGASLIYEDVFIDRYFQYLNNNKFNLKDISIDLLKKHRLILTDENVKQHRNGFNVFQCLIFDTELNGGAESYHLCEGNWYQVT